jgi:hypothetical protein
VPLDAEFDASGSIDPDRGPIKYEWDLDGDGTFDPPSDDATANMSFNDTSNHEVAVRVVDDEGAQSIARVTVYPGDTPPQPNIDEPGGAFKWAAGEDIDFSGSADDAEDGDLPSTRLDWTTRLYHCPFGAADCHAHPLQAFPAVAAGGFIAPEHDYPSYIEFTLTAVDSRGLRAATTTRIDPQTVDLQIASSPAGVTLGAGIVSDVAPFPLTVIEGSQITLSAPETAILGGAAHTFSNWSDKGPRVHTIEAARPATYTALYFPDNPLNEEGPPIGEGSEVFPPPLSIYLHKHPAKRTRRTSARFVFSAESLGARFRCKLDQQPFRSCHSTRVYRRLKPGKHVFRVQALLGDVHSEVLTFEWRISTPR